MFDKLGYLDIPYFMSKGLTYNYLLTGRATGKTYGALKWVIDNNYVVMFMRRSQVQIDMVTSHAFNPLAPLNRTRVDGGEYLFQRAGKNVIELYDCLPNENEVLKPAGAHLGYATALSTVRNLKGFSAEDVDIIIYDECVPVEGEREIRNEADAFRNAYETIARNRELYGKPPVRVIFLGNANNNIACDLLISQGVAATVAGLAAKGKIERINRETSTGVWYIQETPITEAKKNTAIYRAAGEDYTSKALNNTFAGEIGPVVSRNLREYRPWVSIGGICVYRHKADKLRLYASSHVSGSPKTYPATREGLNRFRLDAMEIRSLIWHNRVEYETALCGLILHKFVYRS